MSRFRPGEGDLKESVSDAANAGLLLARMQDQPSLPKIQALAKAAQGDDKKVLDEALRLFNAPAPTQGTRKD